MKKYSFFKIIFRHAPFFSLLYLGLNVIFCFFTYLELIIMQMLIRTAVSSNYRAFVVLSILLILIYIIQNTKSAFLQIIEDRIQIRISNAEYKKLYKAIEKMELTDLDDSTHILEIEQAKQAIEKRIMESFLILSETIGIFISLIAVGMGLFAIKPFFLVCFIVMAIFQKIYNFSNTKARVKMETNTNPLLRVHKYFVDIMYNKEMAKELKSYLLYGWIEEKRAKTYKCIQNIQLKENKRWLYINSIVAIVMFLIEFIMYYNIGLYCNSGEITLDQVVYVIQSNTAFIGYFILLLENYTNISVNNLYHQSLVKIIHNEKECNNLTNIPTTKENCIEMENVSFSYKNTTGKALKNINFSMKKGEKIALLGENGCGKSTLIKIITGLIKADHGIVKIDPQQSVVFQDYSRFKFTLNENIYIGDLKRKTEQDLVTMALVRAGGKEILEHMPFGMETELSKEFNDDGTDLSGGEWQKVAVSRGLFKEAGVFILDEPTASLDPLAEVKQFNTLLSDVLGNRGVIIVSHRVSVARKVDRIVYMKNGRIVETGTYDELMKLKGEFYKFYHIQSKWYK